MATTLTPRAEFQVNTTFTHDQSASAVAGLADGGWVVAWQSFDPGMSGDFRNPIGWDVLWQRYAADGTPIGTESGAAGLINDQVQAAVTSLSGGGFAIACASALDYDGRLRTYDFGVQADAYDAGGLRVAGSSLSTNGRIGNQTAPAVAATGDDQFVLGWQTDGGEDPPFTQPGVVGPTAQATGGSDLAAAGLGNGGHVMAWSVGATVYAQSFAAPGGQAAPPPVRVTADGARPAVAALENGGFVVTWQSADADGGGIYFQRYNEDGVARGAAMRANKTTAGEQGTPTVAGLGDGGFALAWVSLDGDGAGVYVQRFDAKGRAVGGETRVNLTTAGDQWDPSLAATADGGFIATWTSSGQDGSGSGIFAREFELTDVPSAHSPHGRADHVHRLNKAAFDPVPEAVLIGVNPEAA